MTTEKYKEFTKIRKKIVDIEKIISLMHWDQEVMMPEKGTSLRAQQMATISGIHHELSTSEAYGKILFDLKEDQLDESAKKNVELSLRDYEKYKKFSEEFIKKLSRTISEAHVAWMKAREVNDFKVFLPKLREIIELKKEDAEISGYDDHPYDALLDDYERGLTIKELDPVFNGLKKDLKEILDQVMQQPKPDSSFLRGNFDRERQMELSRKVATDLGYDFGSGRLDLSPHPFSTNFGPLDARITTRASESDFTDSFGSTIHEVGHALYEQGQNVYEYGHYSGRTASLSIHESQSRLWENNVGLSRVFIETYFPLIQEYFPGKLKDITADQMFRAMNIVQPSLIRTAADEITYHFHIIIRYELEKGIFSGNIRTEDLRDAWVSKYKEYLGIDVPDDNQGILQDIHWSHGSFGYFPTYSLGSLYAAQFFATAKKAIPGLEIQIREMKFSSLLNWLRMNIHSLGGIYTSREICEKVSGEPLNFKYFNEYIRGKLGDVYEMKW